jgi:peptidoglycan-associated lipoprotein
MKRVCVLVAVAALVGCSHIDRTPVPGFVSAPPHQELVTPPPPVAAAPASTVPAGELDRAATNADDGSMDSGMSRGTPRLTESQAIGSVNGQLEDVYFGYDHSDLSPESAAALRRDAELLRTILRDFPALQVTVEGHCDERGSAEYNLGLGDRRATSAVGYLAQFGLPAASFKPVSYGKEAPQCTESTETCWSRNRRVHFVVRGPATD